MTIKPPNDRAQWEAFLASAQPPTFLQSWAWGETQHALGEEVLRLTAVEGETILGVAQAVTVTARRGAFLHVPHGPVVPNIMQTELSRPGRESSAALLNALKDEARRRNLAFLRVSPMFADTPEHRAWYRALGFRPAPIHLHAERMWVLDLVPSEEQLLAAMRKTTRNLIRRAEREGVTVSLVLGSDPNTNLEAFLDLYRQTARRERFVPFRSQELAAEVRAFGERCLVGIATRVGAPLAGAIVPCTPWSAFYHHGASSRLHPHIPAAHALHWAIIREAKRRGCRTYNFWGIIPTSAWAKHPWAGLTLFKTGFGGREVPLIPTQDLPLSPRYWISYTLDRYRKWRRRL